ncbi:MAG: hypothetical protein E7587_03960 [Ruminococcaceae bacterium]|nr:hypothetical protein [Oscillospiraceae bacterium]
MENLIFENEQFKLTLSPECIAVSLIHKASGTECIKKGEERAFFSLTEPRPFNNEIKLAHPNKRVTFEANRVRLDENGRLIVGFELVKFEAIVEFKVSPRYVTFSLVDFILNDHFGHLCMSPPPALSFRMIQLPIEHRKNFGEWLNVSFDDTVAINVLAASPYALIDSDCQKSHRVLYAESLRDVKLKNVPAALIVSSPDELLNSIETLEKDYNLPSGVASRRSKSINQSIYRTSDRPLPDCIDEHIEYMKKGGFKMMCIYFPSIFTADAYGYLGDYSIREEYNGVEGLKAMLDKLKSNGITPGIHILHPHIGLYSRYVTPKCDHRLRLIKHFTLAKDISEDDTEIYVDQNPEGSVMHEKRRFLNFEGELIEYTSYTTERPYRFTGCKRGGWNTTPFAHKRGTIGGILDISEYCAVSTYIDQETDLQDEIADMIAVAYNAGFEFVYFDGSEGTNEPYEIYVPLAQYRVYKKFAKEPLFCEGAAKAHFSWHMITGGNAFDTWTMDVFKEMIAKYPAEEAPRMLNDFTRLNFGWWHFYPDTMPDIYEYGSKLAAAWNCPTTMACASSTLKKNKRTDDILEVLRRWEDVRSNGFLTEERKAILRNTEQEHTLLINEAGEYELAAYDKIENAFGGDKSVSAFVFERAGKTYVTLWHTADKCEVSLKLDADSAVYEKDIAKEAIPFEAKNGEIIIPIENKAYFSIELPKETVISAFENGKIL